jgi:hypothetical protein
MERTKKKSKKNVAAEPVEPFDITKTASYTSWLGQLKERSDILSKPDQFFVGMSLANKAGLQKWTYDLCGGPDGSVINDSGVRCPARIEQAKINLHLFETKFKTLQADAKSQGRPVPDVPDERMEEGWGKAAAQLTIYRQEDRAIRSRLADLAKSELQTGDSDVLKYGPNGDGHVQGTPESPNGRLVDIDFQRVSIDKDGTLFIDDPRSPYNRMRIEDYRQFVCRPFRRNRAGKRVGLMKVKLPPWPDEVPRPEA